MITKKIIGAFALGLVVGLAASVVLTGSSEEPGPLPLSGEVLAYDQADNRVTVSLHNEGGIPAPVSWIAMPDTPASQSSTGNDTLWFATTSDGTRTTTEKVWEASQGPPAETIWLLAAGYTEIVVDFPIDECLEEIEYDGRKWDGVYSPQMDPLTIPVPEPMRC